jgi:hypothetical protein
MANKLKIILSIFFIFIILCSCSRKENNNSQDNSLVDNINQNLELYIKESVSQSEYETNLNSISDFYFYEIMNGNGELGFHRDEYNIIKLFGEPNEIKISPVDSYSLQGGIVIELHEYIFDDFIHIYYIFENGIIFYIGFYIDKKLDRLKTINIGDTYDKLLSTFIDEFFSWENDGLLRITFYTEPISCEIRFIIKNKIIERIFVNYLLA